MDKRIVYQNDSGGVSVIIPADCGLTIKQIAEKDVPALRVFVKTGSGVVTQSDIDNGLAQEGATVGDDYDIGHYEDRPRPFKIVAASEIPSDRSARDFWTVDEADLTDGVGQ